MWWTLCNIKLKYSQLNTLILFILKEYPGKLPYDPWVLHSVESFDEACPKLYVVWEKVKFILHFGNMKFDISRTDCRMIMGIFMCVIFPVYFFFFINLVQQKCTVNNSKIVSKMQFITQVRIAVLTYLYRIN